MFNKTKIIHFHVVPTDYYIQILKLKGYEILSVYPLLKMVVVKPPKYSIFYKRETKKNLPEINWFDKEGEVIASIDTTRKQIGAEQTWWATLINNRMGNGITIGICDSGFSEHIDLKGAIKNFKNFTTEKINDYCGHNTHLSGVMCGNGMASAKIYRGIAPMAKLCIAKVLNAKRKGKASNVIKGLEWLVENKVDIICLPLGRPAKKYGDALEHACEHIVKEHGIPIISCAGNNGKNIESPGVNPYVITVGACDKKKKVAWFSSRGNLINNKPDLIAPGIDIISCRSKDSALKPYDKDRYYTQLNGTSISAAVITACCALFLAEKKISPQNLKKLLKEAAHDLGYDKDAQGAGLVNVETAFLKLDKYPEIK